MIGIYNETSTKWAGNKLNEKAVCISKVKEYKYKNRNERKSAHIITYATMFENDIEANLFEKLKTCIKMKDIVTLTDKTSTTLLFSKKDYNPFITERTRNLKDIFLVSIDLRGRKVLSVSTENVFILEGYILGGEFTVIASVNSPDDCLKIKLYDSTKKKVELYVFGKNAETGALFVNISDEPLAGDEEETKYYFKKFRPAKPTHTIFVHKKDKEALLKVLPRPELYNIVEITKMTLEEEVKKLLDQHYKAVTFFMDTDDVNDATAKKIYRNFIIEISKRFRLYYEMLNTGKILKTKY